jgi:hypothetical protein
MVDAFDFVTTYLLAHSPLVMYMGDVVFLLRNPIYIST